MSNNNRDGFLFEPRRQRTESEITDDSSDISTDDESDDLLDNSRMENLHWCGCGNCDIMATLIECECCSENEAVGSKMGEARCIVNSGSFDKMCRDPEVLEVMMSALKEVVGEDLRDPISPD